MMMIGWLLIITGTCLQWWEVYRDARNIMRGLPEDP
jgi:hypothetical protein